MVLCVEDNRVLRVLLTTVLTEAGFRILSARDGKAALQLLRQDDVTVDLVVTDLVMPEMLGSELVEQLEQAGLTAPVLFISGYSLDYHSPPSKVRSDFLGKPFRPEDLIASVERLLRED